MTPTFKLLLLRRALYGTWPRQHNSVSSNPTASRKDVLAFPCSPDMTMSDSWKIWLNTIEGKHVLYIRESVAT